MSFVGVAAAVGGATGIYKIVKGAHQNHLANKVDVPEANYSSSPYAAKMLAEATNLKNGPMAGKTTAQQNIYANGANANASVERNATSGSQALALLAGIQGNTNNAFNQLGQEEGNYHLNAINNYNGALQANINEGDKVYQSDLQKRLAAIQEKTSLRQAGTANMGSGFNDIANNAMMYASYKNGQKEA